MITIISIIIEHLNVKPTKFLNNYIVVHKIHQLSDFYRSRDFK